MDRILRRRTVLGATASGLAVSLAGCLGGDDDWVETANGYEGTVDRTGQAETRVAVGAGSGLSFDPAAIKISPGTTVIWEWTSFGGSHDVAATDGRFESELMNGEGETFSHTFTDTGVYRYVCTPHQTQGMLGAVEVVDE